MTDQIVTPDPSETQPQPGSQPIAPVRHEIFAQRVARGVSKAEAYEGAGFKPNAGNAHRLANQPHVSQRITWLLEQIALAEVFDAGWIKKRMGHLADALSEIVIDPATGVRKPGPMFHAQAAARVLELLGREQGIFKDRVELGGQVQVANAEVFRRMTPAERTFFKEMLVAASQRAPVPANDDAPVDNAEPETPAIGVVPAK